MTALERYLRWYIAIRVVVISTVLVLSTLVQLSDGGPIDLSVALRSNTVFAVAGATYLATLVYIGLLFLLRSRPTVQAYIQFFGDLVLITSLVYYLGGATSPFSLLYLIVIAVASALLSRRSGFIVATAALILYGGPIVAKWIPPVEPVEALTRGRLVYNLLVHGFGFYAMALLTSYLARNVTRVERELEEKSEHLADLQVIHRDVIQSISSGLITTDLEGVVTSANQAGLQILGATGSDMVGTAIERSGLFSPEYWVELTHASRQQGKMRSAVELSQERGGRYVGFTVSQLNDSFGIHRGYILIFQDLTDQRRMQEELRIKDRMAAVGELAAGLAHEIGNPLAAISGSVQMLSSSPLGEPSQRKLVDILLKESQRLDRTIKGFLRFARPRAHTSLPFDVAHLLAENFELLKNSEEVSPSHDLEIVLDPPSVRLNADPDHMSQIFWNLARNALRAMPEGGTLKVVGRLSGDLFLLQVIDTGRGMTEEQRANLFHPFQSLFDGGTGIGMAIVYRIVQDHGGRLLVDSRPGAGTTITVELPASGLPSASALLVATEVRA